MLIIPPLPLRRRRSHADSPAAPPPPPVALTLVAASYIAGPPTPKVRLQFDRAISIAGLDGGEIEVDVGAENSAYHAGGTVTVIDPATIEIILDAASFFVGTGVHLTASASTGIVAADDGGTWAGVSFVALPFS